MSSLTHPDIEHIAALAKLSIPKAEHAHFIRELENILNMVNAMNQIPTDAIAPLSHPHDAKQRLREDTITESNERDILQKLAPQAEAGLYIVPVVIDSDS